MRIKQIWIFVVFFASLLLSPAFVKAGCYDNLPLVVKARQGQLTDFQKKVFDDWQKRFTSLRSDYQAELSQYLEDEKSGTVSDERKEAIFRSGLSLIQWATEYYGYLNDGPYPDNPGILLCAKLLDEFPLDPFSGQPVKFYTLADADKIDTGFLYVPEWRTFGGERLVFGYWLIAVGPTTGVGSPLKLSEPLPGNANPPDRAMLVLESHQDE